MTSDNNTPNLTGDDSSSDPSPSETRSPSRRYEPIIHNGDDEDSTTTTGTVRRNRPPAISTSSNYGLETPLITK